MGFSRRDRLIASLRPDLFIRVHSTRSVLSRKTIVRVILHQIQPEAQSGC